MSSLSTRNGSAASRAPPPHPGNVCDVTRCHLSFHICFFCSLLLSRMQCDSALFKYTNEEAESNFVAGQCAVWKVSQHAAGVTGHCGRSVMSKQFVCKTKRRVPMKSWRKEGEKEMGFYLVWKAKTPSVSSAAVCGLSDITSLLFCTVKPSTIVLSVALRFA